LPSYAHGDHAAPPISESAVLEQSVKDLAIIVDEKEKVDDQLLDASWKEIKTPYVEQRGDGYYVVGFKHPTQGKTVYLLMANSGEYYSANFSGKFSGVAAQ
jgi:hypothetical protein